TTSKAPMPQPTQARGGPSRLANSHSAASRSSPKLSKRRIRVSAWSPPIIIDISELPLPSCLCGELLILGKSVIRHPQAMAVIFNDNGCHFWLLSFPLEEANL